MSFEKFQMNDLGDGCVEVLEMRPVSLGVLTSKSTAERFVEFLNALDPDSLSNDFDDPDLDMVERQIDDLEEGFPGGAADGKPSKAEVASQGPAAENPQDEAWRRLEAGEPVGVVSDELGLDMFKLRGQWAARVKHRMKDACESSPSSAASVGEQVECRGCGRSHKATLESDGLCARCRKDLGVL